MIAINDNASPEYIIEFGPIPPESSWSLSVHLGEPERDMHTVELSQETDYDGEGEECSICLFDEKKDFHPTFMDVLYLFNERIKYRII